MHSLMTRKGGAGGGEGRMEEGRGERGGKGGREGERGGKGGREGEREERVMEEGGRECVWERERENVWFDT